MGLKQKDSFIKGGLVHERIEGVGVIIIRIPTLSSLSPTPQPVRLCRADQNTALHKATNTYWVCECHVKNGRLTIFYQDLL